MAAIDKRRLHPRITSASCALIVLTQSLAGYWPYALPAKAQTHLFQECRGFRRSSRIIWDRFMAAIERTSGRPAKTLWSNAGNVVETSSTHAQVCLGEAHPASLTPGRCLPRVCLVLGSSQPPETARFPKGGGLFWTDLIEAPARQWRDGFLLSA